MGGGAGGDLRGTSGRPRAAEAGRAPCQAGIGAGRAASLRGGSWSADLATAKVSRRSSGRLSFPGTGRGGASRARTVSEGSGAPSSARPLASIASNSDSQLGRRRGPAHARLPLLVVLLLLLLPLESRLRAERAPRPAPSALTRLPVLCSAHADAGRPPGAPSPEGQLSAGRRGAARWA